MAVWEHLRRIFYWLEEKTLRVRNLPALLMLFRKHAVDAVLHGHVHVSTGYNVEDIVCSNAGRSVLRLLGTPEPSYNLVTRHAGKFKVRIDELALNTR
jgi:predicted phosphodiesterase